MLGSEVYTALGATMNLQKQWQALKQDAESNAYSQPLAEAASGLSEVKNNVSNYAGLQTVKGSVLPSMMSSLDKRLQSFRDNVELIVKELLADYDAVETHLKSTMGGVSDELDK